MIRLLEPTRDEKNECLGIFCLVYYRSNLNLSLTSYCSWKCVSKGVYQQCLTILMWFEGSLFLWVSFSVNPRKVCVVKVATESKDIIFFIHDYIDICMMGPPCPRRLSHMGRRYIYKHMSNTGSL